MSDSLLQTITGFLVVIIGMLLLTGIIIIFSRIMAKNNVKKVQTVVEENKSFEHVAEILAVNEDEEVIAAIMASIDAYLQQNSIKNVCNIVIRPLVRSSASNAWSQTGRIENVSKKV